MQIIDHGHIYKPQSFDGENQIIIYFMKRVGIGYPGNLGNPYAGTNIQEICRILIDRFQYLDNQIHSWINPLCIFFLRLIINLLEYRAAKRHKRIFRFFLKIEQLKFSTKDGHIHYKEETT